MRAASDGPNKSNHDDDAMRETKRELRNPVEAIAISDSTGQVNQAPGETQLSQDGMSAAASVTVGNSTGNPTDTKMAIAKTERPPRARLVHVALRRSIRYIIAYFSRSRGGILLAPGEGKLPG